MFDASVSIEDIADMLERRRTSELASELDARLAVRVQLLEALCGRRASGGWIAATVPEKRDFAEAYAGLAAELVPALRVRPSSDGPQAITRIFEGLSLPGLQAPSLRHEFGKGTGWKYANALFSGLAGRLQLVRTSSLLAGTLYTAEAAGKSLAIRVRTPSVDPTSPFEPQREAVTSGLVALGKLAAWLEFNGPLLARLLTA